MAVVKESVIARLKVLDISTRRNEATLCPKSEKVLLTEATNHVLFSATLLEHESQKLLDLARAQLQKD